MDKIIQYTHKTIQFSSLCWQKNDIHSHISNSVTVTHENPQNMLATGFIKIYFLSRIFTMTALNQNFLDCEYLKGKLNWTIYFLCSMTSFLCSERFVWWVSLIPENLFLQRGIKMTFIHNMGVIPSKCDLPVRSAWILSLNELVSQLQLQVRGL